MSDPKLDADLRAYLDEQKRAKGEGHTIQSLRLEVHENSRLTRNAMGMIHGMNARIAVLESNHGELQSLTEEHGTKLVHHAAELVTIKRRLREGDDDQEMATGRFDVEEIKRELEEVKKRRLESERVRAEEVVWWKRSIIMWVVGALAFVATSTITVLITMAIYGRK